MTRIDYCQFLASSHTNFTMTYFADHANGLSHDAINRFLRNDKLTGIRGTLIALKWLSGNIAEMHMA